MTIFLLVAFIVFCAVVALLDTRRSTDVRERNMLRATLDRIDVLAYDGREINPDLSTQILDEIRKHRTQVEALTAPSSKGKDK